MTSASPDFGFLSYLTAVTAAEYDKKRRGAARNA